MQGFNMGRYYPPDASNPPRFNTNSHPLGSRASKISSGILTVRFELPFSVWCNHCTPSTITGQGVRFNAAKKKVGAYYSTSIWSFRMKHSVCGGEWEIRTDPKNAAYVCHEGCRRREDGSEVVGDFPGTWEGGEGEMMFLTEEERQKRRDDAFAGIEGKKEEKLQEDGNKKRLEELYTRAETWRDPYDVNAKLRRDFRTKRKVWKKEEREIEGMRQKYSLGIEIAAETEADKVQAGLVDFGDAMVRVEENAMEHVMRKPLFDGEAAQSTTKASMPASKGNDPLQRHPKKLKAEIVAEQSRATLQQTLIGNSRAAIDPFLTPASSSQAASPFSTTDAKPAPKPNFGILKRKRGEHSTSIPDPTKSLKATDSQPVSSSLLSVEKPSVHTTTAMLSSAKNQNTAPLLSQALVDYDSD